LVLTNDGELALKLSHPRFEVEKVYHLLLDKAFTRNDMKKILSGVELEDGFIKVDEANFFPDRPKANVMVALHSGKYRIVRRLFEHIGYGVEKLDRAGYSGLVKGKLKVGEWRYLTSAEVACLKQ
jgi:23S rRNA pseudouridine2605 synthase